MMNDELISKVLANTATDSERQMFYEQLSDDEALREQFYQYKELYFVASSDLSVSSSLKRKSFEQFWERTHPNKFKIYISWVRYAAIFIVAMVLGIFTQRFQANKSQTSVIAVHHTEYRSEKGSVSTICLEDGSRIWLSSRSILQIDNYSNGKIRAKLDGEAYFDLIPDSSRHFVLELNDFTIRDIGTQFNVRAYRDEENVYATLESGQIDCLKADQQLLHSMKPGEYLSYNKLNRSVSVINQDPTIPTAWKNGKFVFIGKSLREICNELENWYNVQIIIKNDRLAKATYTSVIKRTTTIEMVLKMLSLTDKINYKITDKEQGKDIVVIY